MAAKLRVTQVKSTISHIARNRATVRALGPAPDRRHRRGPGQPRHARAWSARSASSSASRRSPGRPLPRRRHEAPRPPAGRRLAHRRGRGSVAGSPPARARPPVAAPRARRRAPVARSRPGSRAARPRSTCASRSCAASRTAFKIEYEIVNVGRIGELAELGAFETGDSPGGKAKPAKAAPVTVNQEILRAVGLVRTLDRPMKVLGQGDLDVALFVVADAFSKSAVAKIEAAGGSVQVLEIPTGPLPALGRRRRRSRADRGSGRGSRGRGRRDRGARTEGVPGPQGCTGQGRARRGAGGARGGGRRSPGRGNRARVRRAPRPASPRPPTRLSSPRPSRSRPGQRLPARPRRRRRARPTPADEPAAPSEDTTSDDGPAGEDA